MIMMTIMMTMMKAMTIDNHHEDDKDDDSYDNYHRNILCITKAVGTSPQMPFGSKRNQRNQIQGHFLVARKPQLNPGVGGTGRQPLNPATGGLQTPWSVIRPKA